MLQGTGHSYQQRLDRSQGLRTEDQKDGPWSHPGWASAGSDAGSRIENFDPLPGTLWTSMEPPWASMIFRVVGKTEAAAAGAGRVERIEDMGADLLGHARSRVDHVEHDPAAVPTARHDQLAPLGHGVLGVEHQVEHGLLEQVGIESQAWQAGAK